jgi:hypothetical protein
VNLRRKYGTSEVDMSVRSKTCYPSNRLRGPRLESPNPIGLGLGNLVRNTGGADRSPGYTTSRLVQVLEAQGNLPLLAIEKIPDGDVKRIGVLYDARTCRQVARRSWDVPSD